MKSNVYTVVFAIILGIVCSGLLAVTNWFTAPYKSRNEKAEEIRNILSSLDAPFDSGSDSKNLIEIYNRIVREKQIGGLTYYEYYSSSEPPELIAVAVRFSGAGVWGPIQGVLALEPDMETIRAIRFYRQEETPGLGGEISSQWFCDQFKGKKIVSETLVPGFTVAKPGTKEGVNSVDGISGATQTSDKVGAILKYLIMKITENRKSYGSTN